MQFTSIQTNSVERMIIYVIFRYNIRVWKK